MLNNVYKALRSILSSDKGDCTNRRVKSSQVASEEGICTFENNIIIPDNISEPVISFVKCL